MAKRTPDHLKVLRGTARKDRMNPDAPVANLGLARAPKWLNERATAIYRDLGAILTGMGVASPDDVAALAILASRLQEVEALSATIDRQGHVYATVSASGGEMQRARPQVAMRNEAMRHAQSLLSEFGLTPAARSKVSAGRSAEPNPFALLDAL